jgi:hypothetical protein
MTQNGPYSPSSTDLKLAVAMLQHATVEDAADAAGVSRSTAFRRLQEEEFVAVLRDARLRAFSASLARLHAMSTSAVNVLDEIMNDAEAPPSVRVRAATSILDLVIRALEQERRIKETEDLGDRVAMLEETERLHKEREHRRGA